ncbi:LVIVD repeat-containing protein [Prolixibacter sp. SD074]|uniref:LVIVD repeat-containing protein n=1 Tax=Prolixibacter sp. SD074 TaxID=2652391 RepID=UPI00127DDAF1|nr:hypothetical protein [Prolixibacter sp. SD074]GET29884.1 hypothetical protein SD074_20860 [Prolixibacter sp. SD074]
MRKLLFPLLILLSLISGSCKDKFAVEYTALEPVYMSYEDLRSAIVNEGPVRLKHPGKIYFKDNYIFVNEYMEGIHVFDNSDPANPEEITFIDIPGNIDMAVRNQTLFADSYIDLVAIDISDLQNVKEVSRLEAVFPYTVPSYEVGARLGAIDQTKGVVIDWKKKTIHEEIPETSNYYPVHPSWNDLSNGDYATTSGGGISGGEATGAATFGVAGSLARFGLYNNYLFALSNYSLKRFDVSDDTAIEDLGSYSIPDPETVSIYNNLLFIGGNSSVSIYQIGETGDLEAKGLFEHISSCDPVVIQGDYAFYTLRGGTRCGSTVNELDVLDISDITQPVRISIVPMTEPYGLGIDDDMLFICDGSDGLKIYDAADKKHIALHQLGHFKDIQARDAIPVNGYLFVTGEDGFSQYDYSDPAHIERVSFIPVQTE